MAAKSPARSIVKCKRRSVDGRSIACDLKFCTGHNDDTSNSAPATERTDTDLYKRKVEDEHSNQWDIIVSTPTKKNHHNHDRKCDVEFSPVPQTSFDSQQRNVKFSAKLTPVAKRYKELQNLMRELQVKVETHQTTLAASTNSTGNRETDSRLQVKADMLASEISSLQLETSDEPESSQKQIEALSDKIEEMKITLLADSRALRESSCDGEKDLCDSVNMAELEAWFEELLEEKHQILRNMEGVVRKTLAEND